MKLRLGLVGLPDMWDARYRPALKALADRFEVRAVCEQVAVLAQQAARDLEATAVDGYQALAARDDVDAILLLSTQWFGPLPIYAACEHAKAVFCAATMNMPPEHARQIKLRVERAGIEFMAELPCRHAPATLRLKELIATQLGAPRLVFCHRRLSGLPQRAGQGLVRGADTETQSLIELVDWCRYVVDQEPTSVVGLSHSNSDGESDFDYEMMSLDFTEPGQVGRGPVAQISSGNYIPSHWQEAITFRPPSALQVCCQRGIAFVDLPSTLVWFDDAGRHLESLESERPVGEQLLSQFYRTVTSLVRNASSLEDIYRALTIVTAGRASAEQGRRVALEF